MFPRREEIDETVKMVICDAPDLVRSESEGASNADLTRRIQRITN